MNVTLPRLGITTTFVDPSDPQNFQDAVKENTRVFFAESLGSPKLDVLDLKEISKYAKQSKVPFIVDWREWVESWILCVLSNFCQFREPVLSLTLKTDVYSKL